MTEIVFSTRVCLGSASARGVLSGVGVSATRFAPSSVIGHATAGGLAAAGATRLSAANLAGTWRESFRGRAPFASPAPAQAVLGTNAYMAATIKRHMINKNGTKVSKGSSPWRFPV